MKLLTELRRHLNDSPAVHWHLYRKQDRWLRATSALDVAEDTCEAIAAYGSLPSEQPIGVTYIALYGLLQCMYVQQDALIALVGCFAGLTTPGKPIPQFRWEDYPEWKIVRTVRNEVAGHPSETRQPPAVHGIVRMTISLDEFRYLSSLISDGKLESKAANTRQLMEAQHTAAERLLRVLVAAADSVHRSYLDVLAEYDFADCFSPELVRDVETLLSNDLPSEIQRTLNLVEAHCRMLKTGLRSLHTDYRVFPGISPSLESLLTLVRSLRGEVQSKAHFLNWISVATRILAEVRNLHECVNEFDSNRLR